MRSASPSASGAAVPLTHQTVLSHPRSRISLSLVTRGASWEMEVVAMKRSAGSKRISASVRESLELLDLWPIDHAIERCFSRED